MPKTKLGELEEQILLALLRLEGESYAVPVANELSRLTGRDVSPATAYMVMHRLEARGLLASSVGTPDPERGGRPRRFYRVVEAALPLLRQSRKAMLALWDGLEADPGIGVSFRSGSHRWFEIEDGAATPPGGRLGNPQPATRNP